MNLVESISKIIDEKLRLLKLDANKLAAISGAAWSKLLKGVSVFVSTTEPTEAETNDIWVDTDDYSRYDITALTGVTTLSADANEVITASGTFTITLHAATSAGIIKRIMNIGTGIVTVAGTINGATNMYLYPGESVELITDGTGWRA